MSEFTITVQTAHGHDRTLAMVRENLAEQGFGVLSEIDLSATLHQKLGVDLPPQTILGACRPELAHQALLADPSVAALLPCNVVVRSLDAEHTVVEAFDPAAMIAMSGTDGEALRAVAEDARHRLRAALTGLGA